MGSLVPRSVERQGELADPVTDPVKIAGAAKILAEDTRVELMFGYEHALGQRLGRVAGDQCHLYLPKNFSAVEVRRHQGAGA